MKTQYMSRLIVELTDEQHRRVKAMATLQGKSIKDYVLEKLFPPETTEAEQKAWQALKTLLNERVTEAEQAHPSTRTVAQITEEILAKLGKA